MFTITAIESFFQSHLEYEYDPADLKEIGSLCEQWLLSFEGNEPAKAVIQTLTTQDSDGVDTRMYWGFAMALCHPSEQTPDLIRRYKRFLLGNAYDIGCAVSEVANLCTDQPVDVAAVFRAIDTELIHVTRQSYRVDLDEVRDNAVAWDDLNVFLKTLDKEQEIERYEALFALAGFPVDPKTLIHQALIKNEEDQEDLMYYRLLRARHQLVVNYTHGVYWLRCEPNDGVTLKPDYELALKKPAPQDILPVYREPGFCEQIAKDPVRFIQCYFSPIGEATPSKVSLEPASEVTGQFLKAGIRPDQLLTHGLFEWGADMKPISLFKALHKLGTLEENNQILFDAAYKAYLKEFSPQQIVEQCDTPQSLAAAYRITGDKALLQSSSGKTRDLVMGQDLGL